MTSTSTIEIEAVGELVELAHETTVSYRFEQPGIEAPIVMMMHLSQAPGSQGMSVFQGAKLKMSIEKMNTTSSEH